MIVICEERRLEETVVANVLDKTNIQAGNYPRSNRAACIRAKIRLPPSRRSELRRHQSPSSLFREECRLHSCLSMRITRFSRSSAFSNFTENIQGVKISLGVGTARRNRSDGSPIAVALTNQSNLSSVLYRLPRCI